MFVHPSIRLSVSSIAAVFRSIFCCRRQSAAARGQRHLMLWSDGSYKQERDYLVPFSSAVARRTVHETTTILLVTLPNIHRCYRRNSDKPFLISLLTTQPHFNYVATLPCNLSLITCFLTLMFHKVVWQHMQEVIGFLITGLLQIYQEIFQWKKLVNWLRFDRIMAMSLWRHFFAPLCDVNLSPLVTTNAPFTASTVTRASTCHCKSVFFHGEFGFIFGGPSTLLSTRKANAHIYTVRACDVAWKLIVCAV